MTKEKWYVELWTWEKQKDSYDPCYIEYQNEQEARLAFAEIRLTMDVPQKSLYKDDGETCERVEQWVLTFDGEYQMN